MKVKFEYKGWKIIKKRYYYYPIYESKGGFVSLGSAKRFVDRQNNRLKKRKV